MHHRITGTENSTRLLAEPKPAHVGTVEGWIGVLRCIWVARLSALRGVSLDFADSAAAVNFHSNQLEHSAYENR